MNYNVEVFVQGEWTGNGLFFSTKEDAEEYAKDIFSQWVLVRDTRVVETNEKPNYTFKEGHLESLEKR